jgi:hypothetical protein
VSCVPGLDDFNSRWDTKYFDQAFLLFSLVVQNYAMSIY